jgi:hypothetical protein
MKPRPIAEVHENVQAFCGPWLNACSKSFAEHLSPARDPREEGSKTRAVKIYGKGAMKAGVHLHLSYGGATNDLGLSCWASQVCSRKAGLWLHVIVAGDDSLVVAAYWGEDERDDEMVVWEGDASMFDQSQGRQAIRAQLLLMRAMGVPSEVCWILNASAISDFVVVTAQESFRLKSSEETRRTGGPDTSVGNFITMASATMAVYLDLLEGRDGLTQPIGLDLPLDQIEDAYLRFGFGMKLRSFRTYAPMRLTESHPLRLATFLKGKWWLDITGKLTWSVLPSRILKVGKSMRNPVEIFGPPFEEACRDFQAGMAECYAHFSQVPILQAFVSRHTRMRREAREELFERYKVQAAGKSGYQAPRLVLSEAFIDVANRYHCTVEDVMAVEEMIRQSPNFCLLRSPLFDLLAEVDYR